MLQVPNVYDAEPIPAGARAALKDLLESGDLFRYTSPETAPVARLETAFAEKLGVRYALAVSSCSAALFLAIKALNLPEGARVLIPAFTFAAVPSAVVHAGCVPVLAEVGDNYRLVLEDLCAKVAHADAILISHMRGHTSDMDAILALAHARGIPVIEDAAHSLGTTWGGANIGTLGAMGCFSFQSYKLINAGEGGMLISDDPDLIARAVIMSGAYEHNWKTHRGLSPFAARWQNRLPLYNVRMSNLAAAIALPQINEIDRRVRDGRRNHDHVAGALNGSPWIDVPAPLGPELRAPDSIQFNLVDLSDEETADFAAAAKARGLSLQVFGMSSDNARAFWNWEFLGETPSLPKTRSMLMRACDVRLPARLTLEECDTIAEILLAAIEDVKAPAQSFGT